MEFRLLGPFEVRDGDRVVAVSRQKHRSLLAILALSAGRIVPPDRLVAGLWGDDPPSSARASLQNFVSKLRVQVGPDVVVTRPAGYLVDVEPDAVDALRFERLVEESRGRTGQERVATLRSALALWRGAPLADLAFEPFALGEVERLEGLGEVAREELVDAELELGLHAELVPQIEALVARNPLRERPRGQLMLALYRCGRQADALDVYQETRRVLVEELGIEPGATLRDLESAILRQDPALDVDRPSAAPASRELRKRATVLFAELAFEGATAGRALEEMRAAAEYHGGGVARAAGDELLAIFGIPVLHEDDPVRAVRAALQMRRALAALTPAVEVRTALATGDLVVADGAETTGRAVSAARRLAETAEVGEILVDVPTATAAGRGIVVEEAGERAVRGESEPVVAFRAMDAHDGSSRTVSGAHLVGRDRELQQLREALEVAVAEERARLVTIAGEAGLGKSRLAAELAAAVEDDATVLVGRCISYGEGATYLPLREAIVQAAGDDPRTAIAEQLAGDEHAELVAERIAEVLGGSGGQSATGEAFWAVRRFLEALAAERPLVLVFDDVHWAEPTFLDLVEYLEQWSHGAPILIVCLTRPELLAQRPGWMAGSIALRPLGDADTAELVAEIAAGATVETRARIVELAEGNPLFAEQLAASAAEGPHALDSVPPSLEALISSRVDRLLPGERAVLERAAVVGREFWHGAVLHLSDRLDVPSVGRHLLELARKGLIRPGRPRFPREDGFRFHHVLIRDVVYESVPAELRADLHERVADWLDAQAPDEDELIGYHLEHAYLCRIAAGPPDRQAKRLAVDAGERLATAGLRGAKRGDGPATVNLLGRATGLLPPADVARRDLLPELGIALWRGGELERAEEAFGQAVERAVETRDRRAELRARLELTNLRLYRHPEGGADELLSVAASAIQILEQLGDDRGLARAWSATATVHGVVHCNYHAAELAALEALAAARRSGWSSSSFVMSLVAAFYYGPTAADEGIRACVELLEEADLAGEAGVLAYQGGLEAMRGHFDEARSLIARSRTIYEELGWGDRLTSGSDVAAAVELLAGSPAGAESILRESCAALLARGERGQLATQAALLGETLYRQARYVEAGEWADVSAANAASDDASAQYSWHAVAAKVAARDGRFEEAEGLARRAAGLAGATDVLNERGFVQLDLAEVLSLAGRSEEAAAETITALGLFERKGNTVGAARAEALLTELATA